MSNELATIASEDLGAVSGGVGNSLSNGLPVLTDREEACVYARPGRLPVQVRRAVKSGCLDAAKAKAWLGGNLPD